MLQSLWLYALLLLLFAALTDFLDGYIARLMDEESLLGASLDPIADKILIVSSYFTFCFIEAPFFKIPLWFIYFVIIKEICILVGALYLGIIGGLLEIKPTIFSKISTTLQSCFLVWLLSCIFFNWVPVKTYKIAFLIVFLSIIGSFFQYILIAYRGVISWLIKDFYR